MDICHLKNAELKPNHQKYKDWVVLRGDSVKDDSGACTLFTEQGSSASQMTASKVMDVTARLLDCARQVADAVPACTQVKMVDAPRVHKFQCLNVQIFGYVFHETGGPNHGQTLKIWWSSQTKFVRTPTCKPFVGKTI